MIIQQISTDWQLIGDKEVMIRSVIAAIKNSYKPLCKHESDNLWCRGKRLISPCWRRYRQTPETTLVTKPYTVFSVLQYNRVSQVQTGESSKEGLYLLLEPVCQCQVDWCLMTFIYVQFCDFSKFTFFHLQWLYLWLSKGKFCDYMWWIVTF